MFEDPSSGSNTTQYLQDKKSSSQIIDSQDCKSHVVHTIHKPSEESESSTCKTSAQMECNNSPAPLRSLHNDWFLILFRHQDILQHVPKLRFKSLSALWGKHKDGERTSKQRDMPSPPTWFNLTNVALCTFFERIQGYESAADEKKNVETILEHTKQGPICSRYEVTIVCSCSVKWVIFLQL